MTIESASYVDDLVATNPATTDFLYEGDDHIRLLKAVLLASFPNIGGAVTLTHTQLNAAATNPNGSWILQSSTTISSTPSTVEFINGSGGVVIDANSDEYLIDFNWIRPSTAAVLQLEGSTNGGSGWGALGSLNCQNLLLTSGVATVSLQGASAMRITGSKSVPSTAGNEASGQVSIVQHDQGSTGAVKVRGWVVHSAGAEVADTWANSNALEAGLGTTLNAFRLSWSAGTFANNSGVVRLFSRKIA